MHISSAIPSAEFGYENSGEINPENIQETSIGPKDSIGLSGPKDSKKGKPGLFAALLDGLTGKSRKAVVSNPDMEAPKEAAGKSAKGEVIASIAGGLFPGKNTSLADNLNPTNLGKKETPAFSETRENQIALIRRNNIKTEGQPSGIPAAKAASAEGTNSSLLSNREPRNSVELLAGEKAGEFTLKEENPASLRNGRGRPASADTNLAGKPESRVFPLPEAQRQVLANVTAQSQEEPRETSRNSENRRKRGERPIVEVRDFRTGETRPGTISEALTSTNTTLGRLERVVVEIPVELSLSEGREIGGKLRESNASQSMRFEQALSQELRENLGADIVRQASIIVRNGGEGTIQLSLKPETLGNVKIRLEMAENKITGHIIVESSEALRAFERELLVLEKAFQDSGFSETSLDMFMAQDNGNYRPDQREDGDFSRFPPELAVSRYESEIDSREALSEGLSAGAAERIAVNMLI